jgi:hypothetical protein
MLFKVLLTVALVGSTTAAEEADVCKRDLSVAKDGFGKAIESCALAPLMGSIIHMTSECAAYFTAATLAKDDEGNFLSAQPPPRAHAHSTTTTQRHRYNDGCCVWNNVASPLCHHVG